jgi:hypothetical protein
VEHSAVLPYLAGLVTLPVAVGLIVLYRGARAFVIAYRDGKSRQPTESK